MEEDTVTQALKAFNYVCGFLSEIKKILPKKGGWKLFSSNRKEIVERKFRAALEGTKNAIESFVWYGKGFAIAADCGLKVDKEFHDLMGLLIIKFNEIHMRLDAGKLDEKLVENLQSQLKILADYAAHFWNIQGISSRQDKEEYTMKIIDDFRSRLWDFTRIMDNYLKSEEIKT